MFSWKIILSAAVVSALSTSLLVGNVQALTLEQRKQLQGSISSLEEGRGNHQLDESLIERLNEINAREGVSDYSGVIDPQSIRDRKNEYFGMANERMAHQWKAIREGMNLGDEYTVYVFLTFDMPQSIIQAYSLEAAYMGAQIVVRGPREGQDLGDFFKETVLEHIDSRNVITPLMIDPRLFDIYQVTSAPTIVLAKHEVDPCLEQIRKRIYLDEETGEFVEIDECHNDQAEYWKIQGNVTLQYALERFSEHGAEAAEDFIDALALNLWEDMLPEDRQTQFQEGFDAHLYEQLTSYIVNTHKTRLQQMADQLDNVEVYETDMGLGLGPAGQSLE